MEDGCVNKMKLKNKIAIITGAARGIGKAVALEFAKEGAKVIISDVNVKESKELVKQIENLGSEAVFQKCDVTKKRDIQNLINKTIRKFQKIDILVNCARVFLEKSITEIDEKEWDKLIDTNLKGNFMCIKNVSEHMKKNKKGKIISISSIAGEVGLINSSIYSAANGGIINLTKELAIELSPYKININVVSPGIISVDMMEDQLKSKKVRKELMSNIPLGRMGTPQEVADAVVFLASSNSNFITGHNLVVDGGWLCH